MQNNQISKENVEKQPTRAKEFGDQAAFDIIAELAPGQPAEEAPVATAEEGGDVAQEAKPVEEEQKPAEETPVTEEPDGGKPEEKPNTDEEAEAGKFFAKIGSQIFKTAEELIKFTESQVGYNRWLTGTIKKENPDWFDADGKLIPSKMKKVEEIKKETEEAIAKMDEGEILNAAEKERLRKAGIVFKEDLETINSEKEGLKESLSVIDEFTSNHPLAEGYLSDLADILEAEKAKPKDLQMTLDDAWEFLKAKKDIEEEGDVKPEDKPQPKKSELDTQVPSSPVRSAGAKPAVSTKDFMDEVMGASGM